VGRRPADHHELEQQDRRAAGHDKKKHGWSGFQSRVSAKGHQHIN
jgi:hypothetical protein